MWLKLGFGSRPASTSPDEVVGLVRDPGDHAVARRSTSPTASFGQGVAVTPIQLATAYAALVNGGTLVQPHVVKAVGEPRDRARRRAARSIDADAVGARSSS